MQVDCPSCGSRIHSDDMNLANMVAKCRSCHALISLDHYGGTAVTPAEVPRSAARRPVPVPPRFHVEDSGSGLTIAYRWYSPQLIFLAFFCVAWDSFLVVWYMMAIGGNAPWLFIVFPVVHLLVGVTMTYYTFAGFFNRTTIRAGAEEVSVRHGPVPWPGSLTLPVDHLDQLYTQQDRHRSEDRVSHSYKVCAVTKDGRKLVLVGGLKEHDQALFIEQRLQEYLRIPDLPVPGEAPA